MSQSWIPLFALAAAAVFAPSRHSAAEPDFEKLRDELGRHPARLHATFAAFQSRPLEQRIQPAPAVLVEYLGQNNRLNGYNPDVRAAAAAEDFVADARRALVELPAPVNRQFAAQVTGIFLVENLGSSAFTDLLEPFDEKRAAGYIALDVKALDKTANQWATWRERSPFRGAAGRDLEATLERGTNDTRVNALQYILLHEAGHLVGLARNVHPRWDRVIEHTSAYPFVHSSWRAGSREMVSIFDRAFLARPHIAYYRFDRAPLSRAHIPTVYRQWNQTSFVSLYAAINPYDDFAETYAMYVHVVLQKRPWTVTIGLAGGQSAEYAAPIEHPRCAAKKTFVENLFSSLPGN